MQTMTLTHSRALPSGRATSLLGRLVTAFQVARERRSLRDLDDRALADVGLTREQVLLEGSRAFWDLPAKR